MPTPSQSSELTPDQLEWIDNRVKRFEANWREHGESEYEPLLDCSDELRFPLLVELIHSDIELRLRHHRPVQVVDYLEKHSEISANSGAVAELLWAEFEGRRAHDPHITMESMLERYPALQRWWNKMDSKTIVPSMGVPSTDDPASHQQPSVDTVPELPGYAIQEVLGRGGMGIVYRAQDLQLNRDVAIKWMRQGSLATADEQSRFQREAAAVAALHHPQVLQVYGIGNHLGQPYLILEYAAKGSLAKHQDGRPMHPYDAAQLVRGIASATEAIHRCGILHRDLKPGNILITSDGTAKIADFGLAKRLSAELSFSQEGSILGTPSYSAPEYLFQSKDRCQPAVDIYSLGAILYELLTGRAPYVGATLLDVLEQLRRGEIVPPRTLLPAIPRDLETICMKCLDRTPSQRYATARDLADDLVRFLEGRTVRARPIRFPVRALRWARRRPITAALIGIAALSVVVISSGSVWIAVQQSHARRVERELRTAAEQSQAIASVNEHRAILEARAAADALHLVEELFSTTGVGLTDAGVSEQRGARSAVDVSARELVLRSIDRLKTSLHDHPMVRARMLSTIGTAALNLGMVREAEPMLEEAIQLHQKVNQSDTLPAAEAKVTMARIHIERRRWEEAKANLLDANRIVVLLNEVDSLLWADIYNAWLGYVSRNPEYMAQHLVSADQAVGIKERLLSAAHPQSIYARTVAVMCRAQLTQDFETGTKELENLWGNIKDAPIHSLIKAQVMNQRASFYQRLNRSPDASKCIQEAMQLLEVSLPDHDHPTASMIYSDAAWIAHIRGDARHALEYQRIAVESRWRAIGFDTETQILFNELLVRLAEAGRFLELSNWLDRSDKTTKGPLGFLYVWPTLRMRIWIRELHGDYEGAIDELRQVKRQVPKEGIVIGNLLDAWQTRLEFYRGNVLDAVVRCERQRWLFEKDASQFPLDRHWIEQWANSAELCNVSIPERIREIQEKRSPAPIGEVYPKFHPDEWSSVYGHKLRAALDHDAETLKAWTQGWLHAMHPEHVCLAAAHLALSERYRLDGNPQQALESCERGLQLLVHSLGESTGKTLEAQLQLARIRIELGDVNTAVELAQEAAASSRAIAGPRHPDTWHRQRQLAMILASAERVDEAMALDNQVLDEVEETLGTYHPEFTHSVETLHQLLNRGLVSSKAVEPFLKRVEGAREILWKQGFETVE